MKKILVFILLLVGFNANGQSSVYKAFPTNQGNWVYRYYDDFGNPTFMFSGYTLSGDTTISLTNYKKIYSSSIYQGAIRENAKIIYFVPDTSLNEYVLYNFNLGLGDTIIHPYGGAVCSNDTVLIIQEDSVLASDGYHRLLYLSTGVTWIEGIGSTVYLFEPANLLCVSGNAYLQCMINDATFNYPNSISTCFVSTEENDLNEQTIAVHPNPSNGQFSIVSENGMIEICIRDLMGRITYLEETNDKTKITIDHLKSGIYILTVVDSTGKISVRRIIVE